MRGHTAEAKPIPQMRGMSCYKYLIMFLDWDPDTYTLGRWHPGVGFLAAQPASYGLFFTIVSNMTQLLASGSK